MTKPSAEFVQSILARESVEDAIEAVAAHGESPLSARLRAEEALRVAVEIAQVPGCREIDEVPDGGGYILASIAIAAVRTLDPEQDKHHLRHVLVSWFGPANVPDNLRFSWETKDKKGGKMNLATPPETRATAAIPDITPKRSAELLQAQNTMATVDQAVMDMASVSEALGKIKAAEFFRRVGDIVTAQTFIDLRNSKKYKDYPIKDAEGNIRRCQNFEEFCQLAFGKSYKRCFELSQNLHLLGPDLYEAAEAVGFKARDYQALKALPQDEQDIVKQALAAESKEQVLDILQDLAARNQSERQAMKKQAEDMKGDLDARDKLLADKSEKLDKVSLDLEKLKSLPPNKREVLRLEQEQEAAKQLTTAVIEAQVAINALLAQLAAIKAAEVSAYTKDHADQTASWFCQQVQFSLQENGIQADMAEIALPEWMRDTAQASPVDQEGR